MFEDRVDAGRQLAAELAGLSLAEPIVLALARGGVPVAAEIARALNAPMDILIVRKVGAPRNPELAIAAIIDGNPPDIVLNREIVEVYGLDEGEIAQLVKQERPELERRRIAYRGGRHALSVSGKTAILVDDGAATGTTMKVAVRAMKRRSPREIVVAIPVAPPEAVTMLRQEAGLVVCLEAPRDFTALSFHYRSFPQLTDEEVNATLHAVARERRSAFPYSGNT
jgi:putative phosphoribosyl transferase